MYCTSCGHEIPDGSAFCTQCGKPVTTPASAPQPPAPDMFNPPSSKNGKKMGMIVGAVAVVAIAIAVVGVFAFQGLFGESPEDAIAADLDAQLAMYADSDAAEGDMLLSEADMVLSGLGAYCWPDHEAYEEWLAETSYEVGDVTVSEDGSSATATATIGHLPLISYVEAYMGERDDEGEEQQSELTVAYERNGSGWAVDPRELEAAVYAAYLPTDEELILSDVYWYFGDLDEANDEFVSGLESSAGSDLELLGITADEFAEAYLDGFAYEVGDVSVDGDSATVEMTITIKSMDEITAEFQTRFAEWASTVDPSTITSEDDLYKQGGQIFLEVTRAAEAKDNPVTLTFTQDIDGVWWMDSAAESEVMGALGV